MYRLLSLLLLNCLLISCAVNPVTGKNELSFVSDAQELSIGSEQYLPSQQSQGGIYLVDPGLTRYVDQVGQRIANVSDRQLPYEFVVLNNSQPNAWALPGGKIAVNRGLLLELDNEAELAAVLSHEVVHAAAKHGAKSMQRGLILQGVLLATTIGASNSDYGNYIVGGAQLGAQLLTQRYGRTAELESDSYGIQYMAAAGYDPSAAITLQQTFVELSAGKDSSWLTGLFSSHPPSQERVDANRASVSALSPLLRGDLELGRERYQKQIAYLRQKQKAYSAFDKADTLKKNNEFGSALRHLDRAVEEEPGEARFYGLRADIHLEKEQYRPANIYYNRALELDPKYFAYYLGRGLSMARLGQAENAKRDLERSNELLPTAIAMNELGQLSLAEGDTTGAKNYFQSAMNAGGETGAAARDAFTRLDLPDNPAHYIEVAPFLPKGRLAATLTNRTGLTIARLDVTFAANANGENIQRSVSLGPLGAGQSIQASSGFRFSETDTVTNLRVVVTGAML